MRGFTVMLLKFGLIFEANFLFKEYNCDVLTLMVAEYISLFNTKFTAVNVCAS